MPRDRRDHVIEAAETGGDRHEQQRRVRALHDELALARLQLAALRDHHDAGLEAQRGLEALLRGVAAVEHQRGARRSATAPGIGVSKRARGSSTRPA